VKKEELKAGGVVEKEGGAEMKEDKTRRLGRILKLCELCEELEDEEKKELPKIEWGGLGD